MQIHTPSYASHRTSHRRTKRASANSTTKPRANSSIEMVSSQVNLFDFSEADQNQGGKCISSPRISRLARKMARKMARFNVYMSACTKITGISLGNRSDSVLEYGHVVLRVLSTLCTLKRS